MTWSGSARVRILQKNRGIKKRLSAAFLCLVIYAYPQDEQLISM